MIREWAFRQVIVIKAVKKINEIFELQLVNYLKATGIEVGLLFNFDEYIDVRRKILENTMGG